LDVQVHSACPVPSKSLVVLEKFFNVLSLRIVERQVFHFVSITGAQKCFEIIVVLSFSFTLDKLMIRAVIVPGYLIKTFCGSVASPMPLKCFILNLLNDPLYRCTIWQRD